MKPVLVADAAFHLNPILVTMSVLLKILFTHYHYYYHCYSGYRSRMWLHCILFHHHLYITSASPLRVQLLTKLSL